MALAEQKVMVEAGYQGFFRPGEWTPVSMLIERQSADSSETKGTFLVESQPLEGDLRYFRKSVDLGIQQRLRTTLYAQISEESNCRVQFRSRDGGWDQVLDGTYLKPLAPYQRLILMVSRGDYMMPKSEIGIASTTVAHMNPEQLPDSWQALESVDLIVLVQDPSAELADEAKREALLDWVRFGGRLVCIGGTATQSYAESFLEAALPVTCDGTREMAFEQPSRRAIFPASVMTLKSGADLLWEKDGVPMMARRRLGGGEVVFSAVNLEHVSEYDSMAAAAWDSLAYRPGGHLRRGLSQSVIGENVDFAFGNAARLPPAIFVFLLLGAYTILVGPVNFYILKKRRRLELAWLTIPAIVAVFSVATYLIGSATKGGRTILREMDVVMASVGEPQVRVEKFASLFSHRKRAYTFRASERGGTVTSFASWTNEPIAFGQPVFTPFSRRMPTRTAVSGAGWPLVLQQNSASMFAPERLFGQWTSQNFTAKTEADLGGPITGEAVLRSDDLLIRLHNGSNTDIQTPGIVIGNEVRTLASFRPGESIEFRHPDPAAPAYPLAQFPLTNSAKQPLPTNQHDNQTAVSEYLRAKLWKAAVVPEGSIAFERPQELQLVGILSQSPSPLLTDAVPNDFAYGGLIVVDVPIEAERGQMVTRRSTSELVHYDNPGFEDLKFDGLSYTSSGGEFVFVCSPDLQPGALRVASGSLVQTGTLGAGYLAQVSCYNFQMKRWGIIKRDLMVGNLILPQTCFHPIDQSVFVKVEVSEDPQYKGQRMSQVSFSRPVVNYMGLSIGGKLE